MHSTSKLCENARGRVELPPCHETSGGASKKQCKSTICTEVISGFQALRKRKRSQDGFATRTSNPDMDSPLEYKDDAKLKAEITSCNLFIVFELEKSKISAFSFGLSFINNSFLIEKFDHVFSQMKCAAKDNLAMGFVLKNIEV